MPKVLEVDGFRVSVLLPLREHAPAHVHVHKAGNVIIVDLPDGNQRLGIRKVFGMRDADVVTAFRIVEANVEYLLEEWGKYHG